ncbi:hypothetical protein [Clostridium chrysemydis]|uniref:hypothetical protein n=1 Tax=Clostridium chrysemydis TaxID=2665504 RepID=UPI0018840DD7|nr:hypothetical protein [Clostridium chrysemydis]
MNKTIMGIIIGIGVCGIGFTSYKALDYLNKIEENKKVIESLEKKSDDLEKENKKLKDKQESLEINQKQDLSKKQETNNQVNKEPVSENKQEPKKEVKKEKSLTDQWQDIYNSWSETKKQHYEQGVLINPTQHEIAVYKEVFKNTDRSRGPYLRHDAAMGLVKE